MSAACKHCGKTWQFGTCESTESRRVQCMEQEHSMQERLHREMLGTPGALRVGDIVLLPNDDTATVAYLSDDGTVVVETPWSAQWVRYQPDELRLLAHREPRL